MYLIINFEREDFNRDTLQLVSPDYIPFIGESVHNSKDILGRYFVSTKEVYYNENGTKTTNIIILAKKIK